MLGHMDYIKKKIAKPKPGLPCADCVCQRIWIRMNEWRSFYVYLKTKQAPTRKTKAAVHRTTQLLVHGSLGLPGWRLF